MRNNIVTKTDSYKIGGHWNMLLDGTQGVSSYFEARKGAKFPKMLFYGLQPILMEYLEGVVVTQEKIDHAANLCKYHFGNEEAFNRKGWEYILNECSGKLPLRIRAVAEGSIVDVDNVLLVIENTDDNCAFLTSYVEGLVSKVWATSTVATIAMECKKMLKTYWDKTADHTNGLDFQLHGFGYRSCSSEEGSALLDSAPLIFFRGTDTLPALETAIDYYNADPATLAFSIPATEHTLSCALGRDGEGEFVRQMLEKYPTGPLSMVGDTYDIYNYVDNIIGKQFRDDILKRGGVIIVRPDSTTPTHPTPEGLTAWILDSLASNFGFTVNNKGYKVINVKIRMIWGDGLDKDGIEKLLITAEQNGYSVENLVFGKGGHYVQTSVYRDLMRCAFKCSSQKMNGVWRDIQKDPLDKSKASKKGRLALVKDKCGKHKTVLESEVTEYASGDLLKIVFENGKIIKKYTFDEVRANALK